MNKKCIELVFSARPGDFKPRRCNRNAGHGARGEYCENHARSTLNIEPSREGKRYRGKGHQGGKR